MVRISALLAAVGILAAGPVLAQNAVAPPSGSKDGENLSQRLNKSGGVIHPSEDVDPGMHVPAPDPHPNSTPVIPPSATGGNSAK